jgi:signal transduction histidine kinase
MERVFDDEEMDRIQNSLVSSKYYSDYILDFSRSMISVINRSYIYEKVNATFCDAHRGFAGSIVGKSLSEVWGIDIFRDKIKGNIDRCFAGEIVKYEASFSVPQTGKRYFEVIFRPFPPEKGEITHLLAETFDITDLKVSERMALEKEEEFRKFETNLPIGFLRCDPHGTIMHANRAFLLIMDCEREETLRCKNLRNHYTEPGLFDLHLEQLLDNKPKSFGRIPLVTCNQNQIVCRISAFMARDEAGNPSYIDYSFEDSSRELMLENRLLQTQKLETIGALAGGIAHDFNNILTTISGYSELLHDDLPESTPAADKIRRIQSAVKKARSLTNQILTFSRQLEQEKVPVKVHDVLIETLGFVESSVKDNITLKRQFRDTNSLVFADPTQLFRVFLNLMTNAIQAMEGRTGEIIVRLDTVEGREIRKELSKAIVPEEYVLVAISDSGKGMDQSLLRRIFEPFFTTREVGKGSGLGLSVVHGIVTEMGGEILVSSEEGKGSAFYLYLPVDKEIRNKEEIYSTKRRIYFIGGNKYESRILSLALENSGYELVNSSDRSHLMKVLKDPVQRPDLIIYMSDSEEMLHSEELKNILDKSDSKVPCILITDINQEFLDESLFTSGLIKQQLVKPVSLKEIKNAIRLSIE